MCCAAYAICPESYFCANSALLAVAGNYPACPPAGRQEFFYVICIYSLKKFIARTCNAEPWRDEITSGQWEGILQEPIVLVVGFMANKNQGREEIMKLYFVFTILLLIGGSQATTLTVCPDGCDYANLQNAIDSANAGDVIEVDGESYPSSGNIMQNVLLDSIEVNGESYPIFKNVWVDGIRINTIFGRYKGANNSFAKLEEPVSMTVNEVTQIPMVTEGSSRQTNMAHASEIIAKIEKNESLKYDNYTIVGYLSLPSKINGCAHFNNTTFQELVSFSSTIFGSSAYFINSKFNGFASFDHSTFNGTADFTYARFNGDAHFDRSSFNKTASFKYSRFNGDASFVHSSFNRTADFRGAMFNQSDGSWDSHFWFARFNGDALFTQSIFNGLADFWGSEFNGKADFGNCKFNYAKFDTRFSEDADFNNAVFNGTANFEHTIFNKSADFGPSVFNRDVSFMSAEFNGGADFLDSKFNGYAYFISNFKRGAHFRSTFNKDVYFGYQEIPSNTEIAGPLISEWPMKKFNGVAYFSHSKFNGNAYFRGIQFEDDAYFTKAEFHNNADFNSSEFKGDAYFGNAKFFGTLYFKEVKFGQLFIFGSDIKRLVCEDGITYLALIKNFRGMEQYDAADDIYFQYMDWRKNGRSRYDWHKYLDIFSLYTSGYGVRPLRTASLGALTLIIFASIYYCIIFEMGFYEALWFSALALLSLPKELAPLESRYDNFIKKRKWGLNLIRVLYILERLIGYYLLVVFITTFSRVMIRY